MLSNKAADTRAPDGARSGNSETRDRPALCRRRLDTPSQQPPPIHTFDGAQLIDLANSCLNGIERSTWQLRNAATQTLAGWQWLETESAHWWHKTCQTPLLTQRLTRSAWMLTRLAGGYRLWPTRSALIRHDKQAAALEKLHHNSAQLFVEASLAQGGAFLKIGQLLSTRADLLPPAWITQLTRLQDQARPESPTVIRQAIEAALDAPIDSVFAHFDATPLACASISQVHRATLHDGRCVAVKVRRPGIRALVNADLRLLDMFVNNLAQGTNTLLAGLDTTTLLRELKRCLNEELDFRREASSMQRIAPHLQQLDGVFCPALITELCSETLLVTEFVEGRKLCDALDDYRQNGAAEKLDATMTRLLDCWLLQILQLGFFHADPHPGNLLVSADGRIALLDFGACQPLTDTARGGYLRLLQAAIVGDEATLASTLDTLGFHSVSGNPDTQLAFCRSLLTSICEQISETPEAPFRWPTREQTHTGLKKLRARLNTDPLDTLPADFMLLARVFIGLGGLFSHYRPSIDLPNLILKHLTWTPPSRAL